MPDPLKNSSPMTPGSPVPYLITVLIMVTIGVAASVAIILMRPDEKNDVLIAVITGFVATLTASILTFMKAQETHLSVNSRLEQFITNADRAARAEGELHGAVMGRNAAEARTDTNRALTEKEKQRGVEAVETVALKTADLLEQQAKATQDVAGKTAGLLEKADGILDKAADRTK